MQSLLPAYGLIAGAEAIPGENRGAFFEQAAASTPDSVELSLAAISARITAAGNAVGQLSLAAAALEQRFKNRIAAEEAEFSELLGARAAQGVRIPDEDRTFIPSDDWREDWFWGCIALAMGESAQARAAFDRVDDATPGELAPKPALAMASEQAGDLDRAGSVVWPRQPRRSCLDNGEFRTGALPDPRAEPVGRRPAASRRGPANPAVGRGSSAHPPARRRAPAGGRPAGQPIGGRRRVGKPAWRAHPRARPSLRRRGESTASRARRRSARAKDAANSS